MFGSHDPFVFNITHDRLPDMPPLGSLGGSIKLPRRPRTAKLLKQRAKDKAARAARKAGRKRK